MPDRSEGRPVRSVMSRIITLVSVIVFSTLTSLADNSVEYSVVDSVVTSPVPEIVNVSVSNVRGDCLDVDIRLISSSRPFRINKVELRSKANVVQPIQPFHYVALSDEKTDNGLLWDIHLEFPYTQVFPQDQQLAVYTDTDTISLVLDTQTRLNHSISTLQDDYNEHVAATSRKTRIVIAAILLGLALLAGCGILAWRYVRQRLKGKQEEIEEMSMLLEQRSCHSLELKKKVDALYGERLETLNMLCNEYFDKHGSDKMKISFCNEVERQILALKDPGSVARLEEIVNQYLDNIMLRIREQIPGLPLKDLIFLTYLYSGLSLRAICIFMDIKIKNFYNRRARLKERILASDAPDKEFFVEKMEL